MFRTLTGYRFPGFYTREEAEKLARYQAAWNYPCHVVDWLSGDIVYQAKAYNHQYAINLVDNRASL